jgi:CubicO group peptidase (beta-lactamase class C family)
LLPGPTEIATIELPLRRRLLIAGSALLLAPARAQEPPRANALLASALPVPEPVLEGFRIATPEAQGFDSARLAVMTRFIEAAPHKVFSMMIARNGHLVHEMLAGDITRNAAHYLMSVTKSVISAIAGAALDRGLIASEDQPIGELLPKELFGPGNFEEMGRITVRHVLNMSALDVPHVVVTGTSSPHRTALVT